MPTPAISVEPTELFRLHAATCLAMTEFIHGHHCPRLGHFIVHQLNRLLSHPDLDQDCASRDMYRQLLTHWQQVTAHLLEQQKNRAVMPSYH